MGNLGGKLSSASPIPKRYCNAFVHAARPPTGTVLNTKKGVIPEALVADEISRNIVVSDPVMKDHLTWETSPWTDWLALHASPCCYQVMIVIFKNSQKQNLYDGVSKWKHYPCYWLFVRGIHRSPADSPHKGQWRGALMVSLICAWTNGWANNRDVGDLRRHRPHCDVIKIWSASSTCCITSCVMPCYDRPHLKRFDCIITSCTTQTF